MGLDRAIKKLRVYWGRKVLADNSNGEIQSGRYSETDYEQASGISKRQVEKKIHEIAKKVDRVWQINKSVLEKYPQIEIPSPRNKFGLHSKSMDTSLQNNHGNYSPIQSDVKENVALNENKSSEQGDCQSPVLKRLKLIETQTPSVLIT